MDHISERQMSLDLDQADLINKGQMDLDLDGVKSIDEAQIDVASVSLNLKERAVHLLGALDEYSLASQCSGYARTLESRRAPSNRVEQAIKNQETHSGKGYYEFYKAFGHKALIEAGYNSDEISIQTRTEANRFMDSHVGPKNAIARDRLRRTLKKQNK